MKIRVLDIGGSGIKTALFTLKNNEIEMLGTTKFFPNIDWALFESFIEDNIDMHADIIGISCAGFIDSTKGVVKFCSMANWYDKPIKENIANIFTHKHVYVLNDAESHLMAHQNMYPHSQMCISLGTSLGFAMSEESGNIVRPADNMNFDIGAMTIPTSASNKQVWWALGSLGLEELQEQKGFNDGVKHFGFRLGSFLADLSGLFRPKTIILSGGITHKYWDVFHDNLISEFNHTFTQVTENPAIIKSPFTKDSALWGIALYALQSYVNTQTN